MFRRKPVQVIVRRESAWERFKRQLPMILILTAIIVGLVICAASFHVFG
jgi:multisubunit Na+/H+ antiporter MnhC subunit